MGHGIAIRIQASYFLCGVCEKIVMSVANNLRTVQPVPYIYSIWGKKVDMECTLVGFRSVVFFVYV